MTPTGRDRDSDGRPRNARPRDALGRPLPYTSGPSAVAAPDPQLAGFEEADLETLLSGAQRLLDQGRPFEAHELLEAAWKRAPEAERTLWRALAQLAVGLTHQLRGNARGARALFDRSAQELEHWASPAPYGIDVRGLAASARQLAVGEPSPVRLTG